MTMTNEQATAIVAEIKRLGQSAQAQVNREFEGHDMGVDLPQGRQTIDLIDLIDQINSSGTHAYAASYGLVSRQVWETARETFNGLVRGFMAANPGKQVPSQKVTEWGDTAGMSMPAIKHFKAKFEA